MLRVHRPARSEEEVIERLTKQLQDAVVDAEIIQHERLKAEAEAERLRGLLREALEDGYIRVPYGASHEDVSAILDFEKRIREEI